ncbi:MAG TPA: MBL fold metallo-hydrolase [Abditibacteriaceae bacterium]|jgi:glyoxylase-like metal-dependent hydrolase (beta-lactamase superfamily II)
MAQQIGVDVASQAENPEFDEIRDDGTNQIASDIAYKRLAIANIVFIGVPGAGDRNWVLVDAGVMGSASHIKKAATERFGENARPAAIVMTHGHFDHVGALEQLAKEWDAPVWAHMAEVPYLTGKASYPPADPTVGGGMMALLSKLYPRGPVDVSDRLRVLPVDGSVPPLAGWCWVHTPGHAPGHVSLWRDADRSLIVGDAFVTTAQESAYAVATQEPELHGPPMYFTPDWDMARSSVEKLAALEPELVITGHGPAMQGAAMRVALHTLARDFNGVAVPKDGKYVLHPANAENGRVYDAA